MGRQSAGLSAPETPMKHQSNDRPRFRLIAVLSSLLVGKLDQFNGNFGDAEMVKAFLVSAEYRQRFGP